MIAFKSGMKGGNREREEKREKEERRGERPKRGRVPWTRDLCTQGLKSTIASVTYFFSTSSCLVLCISQQWLREGGESIQAMASKAWSGDIVGAPLSPL